MARANPQLRGRGDIALDAVFDIETENWTTFVCGGVLYADGAYEAFTWQHEEIFLNHLLSIRGDIWSHNGGRFDIKWVLDWCVRLGIPASAVAAGANIIAAKVGKARFLDSKALTKISLADLTRGANVHKQELGLPCIGRSNGCTEEENECKGYCAIRRVMPKEALRRVLEYLEADCRSLMDAMRGVRTFAAENDLDLGISVGSSAWKSAQRWLGLPPASLSSPDHRFARRAYFGGRVQSFRPFTPRGYEYDVHSMYPSRISQFPLPVGTPRRAAGTVASQAYTRGIEGVYSARVSVPGMHVPPLPFRCKGRIAYPTGSFFGTWTRPELTYAESVGVRVERVTEALLFPASSVLFKPWVDKLFALRHAAPGWDGKPDKKGPLGTFLKYYANSLTGKFGSKPLTEKVVIAPYAEDIVACECESWRKKTGSCRCGSWRPLDLEGLIFGVPKWFIQPCAHVEWAAYCNSLARVELHRQLTSENDGFDVAYCDTDSCFSMQPRTHNLGDSLGTWEDGGEFQNMEVIAPKVYRLERGTEVKVKAKGVMLPRDAKQADKALKAGKALGKSAVVGFRTGAKRGKFFTADTVTRRLSVGYGDRILEPGAERTRAPSIAEVERLYGEWREPQNG